MSEDESIITTNWDELSEERQQELKEIYAKWWAEIILEKLKETK